ncbi:MAG: hypothetical protein ABI904_05060 [Chloroflexota bacterium]
MKLLKLGIRFWITLTSLLSFASGWIMLAHAPKPSQAEYSSASVTTLEPLPPLSDFNAGGNNFQNQPSFDIQSQPRARLGFNSFFSTGGS